MALTVEIGTGVPGADSYVTLAEVRAYALAQGATVPTVDTDLEVLVRKATRYLEAQRSRYKGSKANGQGYLQWPRIQTDGIGVVIDGTQLLPTDIPVELKDAQCQLVLELKTVDPMATTDGAAVKKEQIDVIVTEYAVSDGNRVPAPSMPKVNALLEPLFSVGRLGGITVVRV